jgi:hypothetical protein
VGEKINEMKMAIVLVSGVWSRTGGNVIKEIK